MTNATQNPAIQAAALEYITPNSLRKIVRRPKTDLEAVTIQLPFGDGIVSVKTWGEGEKVLLVHGWATNQIDMYAYVPEILTRGMCAVAIDLPAHGESTGETAGLNLLGEAVLHVGNHFGPLKGIIAHSIGGAATQYALWKGLEVSRAVLLASPNDYGLNLRRFAQRKNFTAEETQKLIDTLTALGVEIEINSAMSLKDVFIPGLIVHSRDDLVIPFSVATAIASHWRGSQILEFDGLNHRGVLKDNAVIKKALDFIVGEHI